MSGTKASAAKLKAKRIAELGEEGYKAYFSKIGKLGAEVSNRRWKHTVWPEIFILPQPKKSFWQRLFRK